MSVADLMSRIDGARGNHQKASDLFADVRAMFEPEEPPPPPEAESGMSASDIGHLALDIAGFVPVVGTAADLVNAGWYAAEGDYKNAALSAAAAIPGAGDAAAAAKLGVKAVDAAQAVKRGAEAYETAEGVSEGVTQLEGGNYGGAGVAIAGAAFGAGGGRGRGSGSGGGGSNGNDFDNPWEDEFGDYAEDYTNKRDRNLGRLGQNKPQNRGFDSAIRDAEEELGRSITKDERAAIHRQQNENDGKYRTRGEIRDSAIEQLRNMDED